ncbi:MAG: GNAT family N-acetyltransferase [Caldilineaceae bacterium]
MSRLSPDIVQRVSNYWAGYLGCDVAELERQQAQVLLSAPVSEFVAFSRGSNWILALPAQWNSKVGAALSPFFQRGRLPNLTGLQQVLRSIDGINLYGPATIFLQPELQPQSAVPIDVRRLQPADHSRLALFRREGGQRAWSLTATDDWLAVWGAFFEKRLVAICAVRVWGDLLAEIYVDTLPAHRQRGYGKAVTNAAVQWIYTNTAYIVESVVELSNQNSLALMASLQFKPYGYLLLGERVNTTVTHKNCASLALVGAQK